MTLEMMSQPGCQPCIATERKASNLGIDLPTTNVREDANAAALCRDLGYNGTPVIVVRDTEGSIVDHWQGFIPDRLSRYATAAA